MREKDKKKDVKNNPQQSAEQDVKQNASVNPVKPAPKAEIKPVAKTENKPVTKTESKPAIKINTEPLKRPDIELPKKVEIKSAKNSAAESSKKVDAEPSAKTEVKQPAKTEVKQPVKENTGTAAKTSAESTEKANAESVEKANAESAEKTNTEPAKKTKAEPLKPIDIPLPRKTNRKPPEKIEPNIYNERAVSQNRSSGRFGSTENRTLEDNSSITTTKTRYDKELEPFKRQNERDINKDIMFHNWYMASERRRKELEQKYGDAVKSEGKKTKIRAWNNFLRALGSLAGGFIGGDATPGEHTPIDRSSYLESVHRYNDMKEKLRNIDNDEYLRWLEGMAAGRINTLDADNQKARSYNTEMENKWMLQKHLDSGERVETVEGSSSKDVAENSKIGTTEYSEDVETPFPYGGRYSNPGNYQKIFTHLYDPRNPENDYVGITEAEASMMIQDIIQAAQNQENKNSTLLKGEDGEPVDLTDLVRKITEENLNMMIASLTGEIKKEQVLHMIQSISNRDEKGMYYDYFKGRRTKEAMQQQIAPIVSSNIEAKEQSEEQSEEQPEEESNTQPEESEEVSEEQPEKEPEEQPKEPDSIIGPPVPKTTPASDTTAKKNDPVKNVEPW